MDKSFKLNKEQSEHEPNLYLHSCHDTEAEQPELNKTGMMKQQ